jgi:hypothetical protein
VSATDEFGQVVQRKAEAHLAACFDAMDAFEEAPDAEQAPESPAFGPFDGCQTCIVREVLSVCWEEMLAEARRVAQAEHYSEQELRKVAFLAAGAGSGAVMRLAPDVVMPTEDITQSVESIVADASNRALDLRDD